MVKHTLVVLILAATACSDAVIELSFRMPDAARGGDFAASCITAIDVYTVGSAQGDVAYDCIELDAGPAKLSSLPTTLAGKINVPVPLSDLTAVEVLGRRGSCIDDDVLPPGELVFYAGAPYIGTDELVLPVDAMSSCDQAPMTFRPVDIISLTTGATKGDCAAAGAVDGMGAGGAIGTLTRTVTDELVFFDSFAGGPMRDGVVALTAAPTTIGPKGCLAADTGDARFGSLTCIDRDRPTACARPGEVEVAGVDLDVAFESIDQARKAKFPTLVFVAVLDANRQPIAGATATIDPKQGEIVYVEPDGVRLAPTGGNATGPSGLMIVYTDAITDVKVMAGGRSLTTVVGSVSYFPGAVIAMLR